MTRRNFRAPTRSSRGFRRKRANSSKPRVRTFPKYEGAPKLLGYPGIKAGMTRVIERETNDRSHVKNIQRISAVTVLETPPVVLFGVRTYKMTPYGLKILADVMTNSPNKNLKRVKRFPKIENLDDQLKKMEDTLDKVYEIRALVHTQPELTGIGMKKPEIFEIKIGAKSAKDAFSWVKDKLGSEMQVEDFAKEGQFIDVVGITKGKGFQGVVKRHGVTKLQHKTKDGTRRVGSIGPWTPARLRWLIPRYGQLGFFRRTEYNKQVMKLGVDGAEINPDGAFVKYGEVKNRYIMLRGSVPGPKKRTVFMRAGVRAHTRKESEPQISMISTLSQQR
ncbi:MAG: 50S ribosomal protein L3 [Candidatus Heimdallarchaeota archaeon]|nr:50S ribosomal protein L3 [Candidatus Heimdallarchaeota archaeon]